MLEFIPPRVGALRLGLHVIMGVTTPQKIAYMVSAIEAGLISPTEIRCRAAE